MWAFNETWPPVLADRLAEVLWVLGHQADIDADFLAIYGIDLDERDMGGPRYFALAHRLTAYSGVMSARVEAEREEPATSSPARTTSTAPTRTSSTPTPTKGDGEVREVSLTSFRMQFPGLVSVAQGG